jgi:hypothetical protein
MTTTQNTAGQELTATLRRYFSVGTRTRRFRTDSNGLRCDLHRDMTEALTYAATMPGYYSERTESALKAGFGAALAYEKHVQGYRISGTLAAEINGMSAWNFAALLGQMVDAGVTNTGAGERFFAEMNRSMSRAA